MIRSLADDVCRKCPNLLLSFLSLFVSVTRLRGTRRASGRPSNLPRLFVNLVWSLRRRYDNTPPCEKQGGLSEKVKKVLWGFYGGREAANPLLYGGFAVFWGAAAGDSRPPDGEKFLRPSRRRAGRGDGERGAGGRRERGMVTASGQQQGVAGRYGETNLARRIGMLI